MKRPPLTRTTYAWAIASSHGGFIRAANHPCGIVTFPTKKEAMAALADAHLSLQPVKIEITVKLAKVAK